MMGADQRHSHHHGGCRTSMNHLEASPRGLPRAVRSLGFGQGHPTSTVVSIPGSLVTNFWTAGCSRFGIFILPTSTVLYGLSFPPSPGPRGGDPIPSSSFCLPQLRREMLSFHPSHLLLRPALSSAVALIVASPSSSHRLRHCAPPPSFA